MARAFTTYWTPDGWVPAGQPVEYAGGSGFLGKVSSGDRVFVTNVKDGIAYLLGAFTVSEVTDRETALSVRGDAFAAPEHLLGVPATGTPFSLRAIPRPVAESLRFKSKTSPTIKFRANGAVDGQTLRAVRELEDSSAKVLESLLAAVPANTPTDASGIAAHSPVAVDGGVGEQNPIYDADGELVRAKFSVTVSGDDFEVILGSRGGTLGTETATNPDYSRGLRVILSRVGQLDGMLVDAVVASRELIRRGLSAEQRRVEGLQLPVTLTTATDFEALASKLQRGQVNVGSTGKLGGNSTRRLLLRVRAAGISLDQITDHLACGRLVDLPPALGSMPPVTGAADNFDPEGILDARRRVERSLLQRQGQPAFRQRLLQAYGGRCAITGCDVQEILEAAHIVPYWGPQTNHVQNGLLLRADLHTLFDRGLFGIDSSRKVRIAVRLKDTAYGFLDGASLHLPASQQEHPSSLALERHLKSISDWLG